MIYILPFQLYYVQLFLKEILKTCMTFIILYKVNSKGGHTHTHKHVYYIYIYYKYAFSRMITLQAIKFISAYYIVINSILTKKVSIYKLHV